MLGDFFLLFRKENNLVTYISLLYMDIIFLPSYCRGSHFRFMKKNHCTRQSCRSDINEKIRNYCSSFSSLIQRLLVP